MRNEERVSPRIDDRNKQDRVWLMYRRQNQRSTFKISHDIAQQAKVTLIFAQDFLTAVRARRWPLQTSSVIHLYHALPTRRASRFWYALN